MSNATDNAMWFLGLGDGAPPLATTKAALAAFNTYLGEGSQLYPGVTLRDATNGLVSFDELEKQNPELVGQLFCVWPTHNSNISPQAKATIEYNTAFAKGADSGFGFWAQVMPVKAQDSTGVSFVPDAERGWLSNAWTYGSELSDWASVLSHAATWKRNKAGK